MTRIMMATVPHVTSGLGLRKFQADGFLLTRVYMAVGLIFVLFGCGAWSFSLREEHRLSANMERVMGLEKTA